MIDQGVLNEPGDFPFALHFADVITADEHSRAPRFAFFKFDYRLSLRTVAEESDDVGVDEAVWALVFADQDINMVTITSAHH